MDTLTELPTTVKTGVTRVATIGFAPPPRLNLPTGVCYTDTDGRTGERSRVSVHGPGPRHSQEDIFRSLLNMTLIELSHILGVDPRNPPSWVPSIDAALDAQLMLTEGDLYDRLFEEVVEEEERKARAKTAVSRGSIVGLGQTHDVPLLFSEISLALEDVSRQGGVRDAFIDPSSQSRDELVRQAADRASSPMGNLGRMFDLGHADMTAVRLATDYVDPGRSYQPVGQIDDLVIATALAWTTNLATSARTPTQDKVAFWLCDAQDRPMSESLFCDVRTTDGSVKFDLNLSDQLGSTELESMTLALGKLVFLSSQA